MTAPARLTVCDGGDGADDGHEQGRLAQPWRVIRRPARNRDARRVIRVLVHPGSSASLHAGRVDEAQSEKGVGGCEGERSGYRRIKVLRNAQRSEW